MNKENFKKEDFNVEKSIQGQNEYCRENEEPQFAPRSGVCWSCHRNIYKPIFHKNASLRLYGRHEVETVEDCDYITGITTETAKNSLVTGCPHCNKSYLD